MMNTNDWPDSAVKEARRTLDDILSKCDVPIAVSEKVPTTLWLSIGC